MDHRAFGGGRPVGGFLEREKSSSKVAADILLGMRAAGTAVTVHVASAVLQAAIKLKRPDLDPRAHLSDDTIRRWLSNTLAFSYRVGKFIHASLSELI